MTESVLDNKTIAPDEEQLTEQLGPRAELWFELSGLAAREHDGIAEDWSFYSKRSGWVLLVKRGKLTLCTLIPTAQDFVAIFLFPERAVAAARAAQLPDEVMTAIEGAKVYAQGRPFRVLVRSREDLPAVRTLLAIKRQTH